MIHKEGIDDIDLKIISLLREDSRLSFREIGKRINVSTGTVSERVKIMMEDGVIRSFTTTVDPDKLGLKAPMFLRIRVKPEYSIEKLVSDFRDIPESCWIHQVTGDLDMIVLVRCTDHEHAANVLNKVRKLDGIALVESNMVLKAFPLCGRCWWEYNPED
jgi:Lrp/AsnC family transcriptional regulator for asnA, asnC and gidA